MDIFSGPMRSPELLDLNAETGEFTGIMQRWQERARELGYPIANWIVENNVAQKFMLQYDFVRKWREHHRTNILPHTTTAANKPDPERGVWSMQGLFAQGLVRIPWHTNVDTRTVIRPYIKEITTYDFGSTDDQVMAQWFLEYNRVKLSVLDLDNMPLLNQSMPGFLRAPAAPPWRQHAHSR